MSKKLKITLIATGAIVLWALLTIVNADYSCGFMVTGYLGLVIVALALASLTLIVVGLVRWRKKPALYGLLIGFILALSVFAANKLGEPAYTKSIEQGEVLIDALRRHRSDTGHYPSCLSDLVPAYTDTIPLAHIGLFQRCSYGYSGNDSAYILLFPRPAWTIAIYDSRTGEWVIDD